MEDDLNVRIGVLTRREVEARMLAPLIRALGREFGEDQVMAVVHETIADIAREQGAALAAAVGGNSLAHFARSLHHWKRDGALEIEVVEQTDEAFAFKVTRCRYAELYAALGIREIGGALSCGRDFALIEGFNRHIGLQRTQTIMDGAPTCDFRYRLAATG